jgi:hypothetical protein
MMKSNKRKPKAGTPTRGELSEAELAKIIEEATVDAYDESEHATGWFAAIGDRVHMPFEAEVLGVTVMVKRLSSAKTSRWSRRAREARKGK